MKKYLQIFFAFALIGFILSSCGESKKAAEIKSLTEYKDNILMFSIKYPSNWDVVKNPGDRFIIVSNKLSLKRFRTFDPEGDAAAKIEIQAIKLAEGNTIDSIMARKLFQPEVYSAPENVTISGVNGKKQKYQFPLNDGVFQGEIFYFQKHPEVVTVLTFEAFGGTFDLYKEKFNEILNSVVPGSIPENKVDTVKQVVEADPPSEKLVNYNGEGFSIQISDNLDVKNPKIGGVIKSYQFIGERRGDCDIRIDIIDASKQKNVEKIADQNKAAHGNSNPTATSLSGQKAMMFSYSPVGGVMAKVWYVVNNDKCYRITMNWFKGEEAMFKPIFEKSVNSIKFK